MYRSCHLTKNSEARMLYNLILYNTIGESYQSCRLSLAGKVEEQDGSESRLSCAGLMTSQSVPWLREASCGGTLFRAQQAV